MRAVYENAFMDNTLTVTTENANFPKENLQNTTLARVFKTTSATSQRIEISGTDIRANYIFILNHNLTGNADIKLQATNSDWTDIELSILIKPNVTIAQLLTNDELEAWSAPLYSDELYEDELYGGPSYGWGENIYTFDKWSLLITDPNISELEIGLIFLGEYVQLPQMSPDQDISQVTESVISYSETGQAYGDLNYDYRAPSIKCPYVTEAERTILKTMWDTVKNVTPFLLMIWEDDIFTIESPIYCTFDMKKIPEKKNPGNRAYPYNTELKFKEAF